MESTQVIDWDAEEEEETEIASGSLGYSVEPVGRLRLFSGTHGPERDFPLYIGKNVVGRSPDCSVTLPFPSISKQHAVIEISALNKAPILQDCGSLNGTQIVKPPRVLSPGVSHRLRHQELILFADFPCQYLHLDVPPPLVPQRLLTVEKTPGIQGGSQTSRALLAEDSEEEADFPSRRCVANGFRNTTSPSATVVPESDDEDSFPAPSVPEHSLPFELGSDTDEEQQPAVGESSLAPRDGAAGEAEQPDANGAPAGIQLVQAQPPEQQFKDTKVKRKADSGVVLAGSILERSPTLGEDSDTEVDEEHQPSGSVDNDAGVEEDTPPVLPWKQQQVLGVVTRDPGAPGVAHLQDTPAGGDTGVEQGKTALAPSSEGGHTSMVINSDTDEEGDVAASLALAHLKERGVDLWSRNPGVEEVKSQPQVLVERSQSASGRDSDTDMEEGLSGENRGFVPDSPMDIDEALVVTHPESQPSQRPSGVSEAVSMSSPGSHLEGNQASSATVDKKGAKVEEEVPPGPSFTLEEKRQVPVEEAQAPDEAWETAVEEGSSSAVADVRKIPGAGTEQAAALSEQESSREVGAPSRSAATPVEQAVVCTDTSGDPALPQREGALTATGSGREARVGGTQNAKDCCDEPEDLCLPATQCFVESESQNPEAVQSLEDEPTQVFPCTLPQEPGPSHLSLQTPGPGTLDAPWEVLATQPFCLREQTEASEPQLAATHLEAGESHPSLPRAPPGHQHVEGREIQTVEKAMGLLSCQVTPAGKASGGDPEPPSHRLSSPVPGSSAPPQSLLTSKRQKQSTPQPPFSTSSPSVGPRRSSRMTPSSHSSAASGPTSQAVRGRANKSSTMTPELIVPTDPELHPPTSTEQPVTPSPTPRATRGRLNRSSIKTPEPFIPTVPDLQPPTSTEQPVIPKPTSRGRSRKSSLRTPEAVVPACPELQPLTSVEQPVIPKPRATRGRPSKSSLRTPEPGVPTGPELQPPTSTEQPAALNLTSRTSRGRSSKSVRTPEPSVPTGPEFQPPTSTEQPAALNLTSRTSRGRSSKSVRTPEPGVPTGPELQPPTSTEPPDTPEPSSQGRTLRSSVRTPEASVPITPKSQPSADPDQPVPKPPALGTRQRACKSSTDGPESAGLAAPDSEPLASTDRLVIPEVTGERVILQSSPVSASSIPSAPELQPPVPTAQPVLLEPIPQASQQRRRRAVRKQASHTVAVGHKPNSASEPEPQSSVSQSSGPSEASESDTATPEPAMALIQSEAARGSGIIPKPEPGVPQVCRKPSTTSGSPLEKRPRRQVPQKTVVIKEEDPAEAAVREEPQERAVPTPGKRKRNRAENETQGNPNRSQRTKPNQEATAPKVLFTGVVDSRGERAVLALGGSLASSVNEASHLVTDRIRRTVKFLCALGKGIPILSLNWLYQSRKAGCFLPPDDYLVTDPEQEKNFSFSLRDSLRRAQGRRLLEGYEIHVTPAVQPPPSQMGEIIICCGGAVLPRMPHSYKV
ncbi:mediator of DNA damage checkpoint protein 1 isoform X2 [Psammomys obesus]|uniref:mediator of DNA damage checkpoint protein 1 isoform X2 n=1 Tax=Psammomys obesus TaxID=48139 RepID=UPI002452D85E|nr:mediator of DNA damage checkpoint protein 1 isoform X2 [Psammomys obesus]